MNKKTLLSRLAVVIIPLLALIIFIYGDKLIELSRNFRPCYVLQKTGFLCPACGNTKSVICLLHGDISGSISYNITPLSLLRNIVFVLGKTETILPKSFGIGYGIMFFLILYYILRNIFPISAAGILGLQSRHSFSPDKLAIKRSFRALSKCDALQIMSVAGSVERVNNAIYILFIVI